MLSDKLLDGDRRLKGEAPFDEIIQQAWQHDLRDIEQDIHVSGEAGPSA